MRKLMKFLSDAPLAAVAMAVIAIALIVLSSLAHARPGTIKVMCRGGKVVGIVLLDPPSTGQSLSVTFDDPIDGFCRGRPDNVDEYVHRPSPTPTPKDEWLKRGRGV